jgi:coenzyme F420-dependent glucose-6-phosphate dehydrogenase
MLRLVQGVAEQFGAPLLDFAIEAERAGFDSVFISDHFNPGVTPTVRALAFAAAAAGSTQPSFGTNLRPLPFAITRGVAQAFGTAGLLRPRPFICGLGTGEHLNEGARHAWLTARAVRARRGT